MPFLENQFFGMCHRAGGGNLPGLPDELIKAVKTFAGSSGPTQDGARLKIRGILAALPPEVKNKYAGAFRYLMKGVRRAKFSKPDESAVFKMPVTVSSRSTPLDLWGEGIPSLAVMEEIASNLKIICPLVKELAESKEPGPWRFWFARDSLGEVRLALKNMDLYLNQRCERISFRVLKVGDRCDAADVEEGDAGQIITTVAAEGEDRQDFRGENGHLMVPSGLRIFLLPYYFSPTKVDEIRSSAENFRFCTLCHELSHKIVDTVDVVYGLDSCRRIQFSPEAARNADNWCFFLADYAQETKRLKGRVRVGQSQLF
jgi:hypothetical protein